MVGGVGLIGAGHRFAGAGGGFDRDPVVVGGLGPQPGEVEVDGGFGGVGGAGGRFCFAGRLVAVGGGFAVFELAGGDFAARGGGGGVQRAGGRGGIGGQLVVDERLGAEDFGVAVDVHVSVGVDGDARRFFDCSADSDPGESFAGGVELLDASTRSADEQVVAGRIDGKISLLTLKGETHVEDPD